jgi:N-acetylmuramoyl-L-alanine amidase
MAAIQVRNRLRNSERVAGATLQLTGPGLAQPVTAVTNNNGVGNLATTGLADGAFVLTVTPANTTADPVGPTIAATTTPDRIFRSLVVQVTLASGAIRSATVAAGNTSNGQITTAATANQPLVIALQPVWMRSPNHGPRGSHAISGIIIHHTGGPTIGGAISTFLGGEVTSAHYLIDTDGQIVKMVQDRERANHAGTARWNGDAHVNQTTIGIEIVNSTGAYPNAQYAALTALLGRLRSAFPTIVPWNVIGHSDVATNDSGRLGRKSGDPGSQFEWSRVEALGLGMSASATPMPPTLYSSFFVQFPNESLRSGDNDRRRRFGGAARTTIVGDPIHELQSDLQAIGYSIGTADGDFGEKTKMAVQMLQEHFFAGGRGHKSPDGRVDQQTAVLIKRLVLTKLVAAVGAAAAAVAAGVAGAVGAAAAALAGAAGGRVGP